MHFIPEYMQTCTKYSDYAGTYKLLNGVHICIYLTVFLWHIHDHRQLVAYCDELAAHRHRKFSWQGQQKQHLSHHLPSAASSSSFSVGIVNSGNCSHSDDCTETFPRQVEPCIMIPGNLKSKFGVQ